MEEPKIVVNKPWGVHVREQQAEAERRRRILINFFWFFVCVALLSIFARSITSTAIVIVLILIIIFRKKIFKKRDKQSWERISSLPNWAYKKMKKRKTDKVNGEHYVYLKEGNKFYRKIK
jgi:hypothetical protein